MSKANSPNHFARPQIVGRSSSHFTRVLRMFAEECGVSYDFQVVNSRFAEDPSDYGGNPGLRLPNLITTDGTTFGSLPGCRLISSLCAEPLQMVWPEQTPPLVASNAMELAVQGTSTKVSLIMVAATGSDSSR
jgi:hypothetical protein